MPSEKELKKLTGPDNENWTQNPWILLMIKDNEKSIPFWFLIKREKSLTGYFGSLWARKCSSIIANNLRKIDDEIKRILEYIIAYPQKFKLSIIIPNFLQ